jgi:hypothetical protein
MENQFLLSTQPSTISKKAVQHFLLIKEEKQQASPDCNNEVQKSFPKQQGLRQCFIN